MAHAYLQGIYAKVKGLDPVGSTCSWCTVRTPKHAHSGCGPEVAMARRAASQYDDGFPNCFYPLLECS